jgi:hypothetical protein
MDPRMKPLLDIQNEYPDRKMRHLDPCACALGKAASKISISAASNIQR